MNDQRAAIGAALRACVTPGGTIARKTPAQRSVMIGNRFELEDSRGRDAGAS